MRPAGVRSWLDLRMADSSDKETNTNEFTNRSVKHKPISKSFRQTHTNYQIVQTNTHQLTNRSDKHKPINKLIWQAKTDKRNRPHKRKLSYWPFRQKHKSWNQLRNIFESLWGDRAGDQTDSRDWIGLNLNQDHGSPRLRQKDHRNSIRERPKQVFSAKITTNMFSFSAEKLFLTD